MIPVLEIIAIILELSMSSTIIITIIQPDVQDWQYLINEREA
jgi:hypothetical protein